MLENTIIVFTSDNGGERFADTWPFTGRKTELLEGGLRIPSIVHWPAKIRSGRTTEQVSISMDWFPTLLAAAGTSADPDYPTDGLNLLPMLTGSGPNVEIAASSGVTRQTRSEPLHRELQVPQDTEQHIFVRRG